MNIVVANDGVDTSAHPKHRVVNHSVGTDTLITPKDNVDVVIFPLVKHLLPDRQRPPPPYGILCTLDLLHLPRLHVLPKPCLRHGLEIVRGCRFAIRQSEARLIFVGVMNLFSHFVLYINEHPCSLSMRNAKKEI